MDSQLNPKHDLEVKMTKRYMMTNLSIFFCLFIIADMLLVAGTTKKEDKEEFQFLIVYYMEKKVQKIC